MPSPFVFLANMTSQGMVVRLARVDSARMTTLSLRRPVTPIFAIDAVLAAGLGASLALLAGPLHELAGAGLSTSALRLVGLGLLPWAAHNWHTAFEPRLSALHFGIQAIGDALWVAISVWLCVTHWADLTVIGKGLYAPQTVLVAGVFVAKVMAFLRQRA